jgi:multicomponent Na+:H+ antiporter subunit F
MNFADMSLTEMAVAGAIAMIGLSLFLAFVRLVLGPTLPDRVVALDVMGVLAFGGIAVFSVQVNEPVLMDSGTVLALVGFLGTIGFARYLEKRGHDE